MAEGPDITPILNLLEDARDAGRCAEAAAALPAAAGAVLPVDGAGRANAVVKIRNFAAFITIIENMYQIFIS
jgi:hypothetical protein